jgi:hypothetical protein
MTATSPRADAVGLALPVDGPAVGVAAWLGAGVAGRGVGFGFGVGFGVGLGVGLGVAFGRGLGATVGFGVGFGVGAGVGATMSTSGGETAVRTTDRWPPPLPLVAAKVYAHDPAGRAVAIENVTPRRNVIPAAVKGYRPSPATTTSTCEGAQPAPSA